MVNSIIWVQTLWSTSVGTHVCKCPGIICALREKGEWSKYRSADKAGKEYKNATRDFSQISFGGVLLLTFGVSLLPIDSGSIKWPHMCLLFQCHRHLPLALDWSALEECSSQTFSGEDFARRRKVTPALKRLMITKNLEAFPLLLFTETSMQGWKQNPLR